MSTSTRDVITLMAAVIGTGRVPADDLEQMRIVMTNLLALATELTGHETHKVPMETDGTTITITKENFVVFGGNQTYVWPQVVALARFLYERAENTFSTQDIINQVLGGSQGPYAVYTLIGDFRRAIGALGGDVIKSGRGRNAGYTWNPEYTLVIEGED